jgi:hypothetical protein
MEGQKERGLGVLKVWCFLVGWIMRYGLLHRHMRKDHRLPAGGYAGPYFPSFPRSRARRSLPVPGVLGAHSWDRQSGSGC